MSDVTRILAQIDSGDPQAAGQLLPLVYDELRKLAAAKLAHEKPGQTLQATALVHEAYLRLVGQAGERESGREGEGETMQPRPLSHSPPLPLPQSSFHSRGHFFAAAAEAMRRILVESARRKAQVGRGGDHIRVAYDEAEIAAPAPTYDLIALDESLERLEAHDALAAQVVKLRYFVGMSMPEAAAALGISLRTAERNWTFARTWLHRDLR